MNSETLKGKWHEVKGSLRQQWGRLTDSDFDEIGGNLEKLVGRLQKRYGYSKDQAQREVDEAVKKLD
jgi:uncharacterized protein YjbJ (UPF0337 family)